MGFLRTLLGGEGRPGLAGPAIFIGGELIKGLVRTVNPKPGPTPQSNPNPFSKPDDVPREPPAAPPAEPTPQPVTYSPYGPDYRINEPKRQSGRKARNASKARRALRAFSVWYDNLPQPVRDGTEYVANNPMGMPGTTLPRSGRPAPSPSPGTGTRSAQRGFVAPELVPLIANPPAVPRAVPPARAPRLIPGADPLTQPQPAPARTAPAMPGGVEPTPTAPQTSVPEFYEPDVRTAIERVAAPQPVYPGPGPATATPGTTRSPGTVGPSTAKPGKTGTRTPVALPSLGKIVLPADALLTYAVGTLPRRSSAAGTISPGVGPATARTRQAFADPLPGMSPQRTRTNECECEKPKAKDRRPRPPRSQCFTGTYTETARGLIKRKRQQVPC